MRIAVCIGLLVGLLGCGEQPPLYYRGYCVWNEADLTGYCVDKDGNVRPLSN